MEASTIKLFSAVLEKLNVVAKINLDNHTILVPSRKYVEYVTYR
jgi:hypothetical protein